jgi:hypothetical protein
MAKHARANPAANPTAAPAAAGPSTGSGPEAEGSPEWLYALLELPAELLAIVAAHLARDDELAAALTCLKLRQAVAASERRAAWRRLSTCGGSVFSSLDKLKWAVSAGMPLDAPVLNRGARGGKLLNHAARARHVESLQWLRAHGCE